MPESNQNQIQASVLIADLCDSTSYKLERGHRKGIERNLIFLEEATKLVETNGGKVVKELGDAVLAIFEQPMHAIVAACNFINLSYEDESGIQIDLSSKISITYGTIERVSLRNREDYLGTTIDRCSRINSICLPKQVLLDAAFEDICGTNLKDEGIILSKPEVAHSKDFKRLNICEAHKKGTKPIGMRILQFPPFVEKILCESCGLEITYGHMKAGVAIITFEQDIPVDENEPIVVKDIHWYHKGKCDVSAGAGWRDLQELIIPELYLDLLLTIINLLSSGEYKYTERAKQNLFNLMFALYPHVFRRSSKEEYIEFQRTRSMLDRGL